MVFVLSQTGDTGASAAKLPPAAGTRALTVSLPPVGPVAAPLTHGDTLALVRL